MSTLPYFVPTRFVWRFGGKQVSLCGSFTRWVETVQMLPVDQSPGLFAVLVHLPPGCAARRSSAQHRACA